MRSHIISRTDKKYKNTIIKGEDSKIVKLNLQNDWNFLPNYDFYKVFRLLAKNKDEKCEIICDSSYHTQGKKKSISSTKNNIFKL